MERPLVYLSERLWSHNDLEPKSKTHHAVWFGLTCFYILLSFGVVATECARDALREPWSELWRS